MTFGELVERLDSLDGELTIYAEGGPEATKEASAVAAREPEDGTHPAEARGLEYLLEVDEARRVLDVWRRWRGGREPGTNEKCEAISHYAARDAYLPTDR